MFSDIYTATTTATTYFETDFANPTLVSIYTNDTSTFYVGGGTTFAYDYIWETTTESVPFYYTTTTTVEGPTTTLDNACNPTNVINNPSNIKGEGAYFIHYSSEELGHDSPIDKYSCCDYCLHQENCAAWVGGWDECWFKWNDVPSSSNDTECCGLAGYLYGINTDPNYGPYYAAGPGCGYVISGDGS